MIANETNLRSIGCESETQLGRRIEQTTYEHVLDHLPGFLSMQERHLVAERAARKAKMETLTVLYKRARASRK